jgi:hypothetical protein
LSNFRLAFSLQLLYKDPQAKDYLELFEINHLAQLAVTLHPK